MTQRMLCVAAALLVSGAFAGVARPDSAYHTERIALRAVGDAPGGGAVVNIHTNGPQLYAHEVYTLRDASVGTYVVLLNVFPTTVDCTGAGFAIALATLATNPSGNGQADFKFTPELVAPFRGQTFGISWTVAGPATYASDCTPVTLD